MDPILQLNEFFVEGGDREKSHVLLHITEPSTPEEKKKGYFFAVAELNDIAIKHISLLQEIIDGIENKYYEVADQEDKNSLELVLEETNQNNQSLASKAPGLNCVVGAIRQREIMFSYFGKPDILLFYKNKQGLYQKMDLIESGADEDETPQLFSQLIQGKISPNDFLFVGTPHIHDYFTVDRLQKIITTKTAQQSAEHIQRVLAEIRDGLSFGGLVIHLRPGDETTSFVKKPRPTVAGASRESLSNLFVTERNTAETLSPAMLRGVGDKLKSMLPTRPTPPPPRAEEKFPQTIVNAAHAAPHRTTKKPTKQFITKDHLATATRIIISGLQIIFRACITILILLWNSLYSVMRNLALLCFVITNYQNRRRLIVDDWSRQWRNFKEYVLRLPLLTKVLLIGSVAVGLIFIGSIWYIKIERTRAAAALEYKKTLDAIKSRQDATESALIYKNYETALANIHEAEGFMTSLSCKSKDEKAVCQPILDRTENLLARARKMTVVSTTPLATNLPDATQYLLQIQNKIFGFSNTTSSLLVYDVLARSNKSISATPGISGFLAAAAPKENDYIALLFNKKDLIRLNPADNTTKLIDVSYPGDSADIASLVIYNRRLYSVDRTNNQIYKHESTQLGFGPGKPWLKNTDNNIRNAASMAIDGDIFILSNDGTILKFTNGVGQPFPISGLDPALTSGGTLWTYNDVNNLYILDSTGKRLIILDKEGHLQKQITAKEFIHPTGLIVDELNATAYISDSGNLYKISLP